MLAQTTATLGPVLGERSWTGWAGLLGHVKNFALFSSVDLGVTEQHYLGGWSAGYRGTRDVLGFVF